MSLQLVVIKATNLPNAEKFGESDPYVSIEFQGKMPALLYTIPGVKRAVYFYILWTVIKSMQCLIYRHKEEDRSYQV